MVVRVAGAQVLPCCCLGFSLERQAKYNLSLRVGGIPLHRIASESFLLVLLQMNVFHRQQHAPEVLYEVLLPFLCGGQDVRSVAAKTTQPPSATPQRSGTCFYRSSLVAVRYLLFRSGMSAAAQKQVRARRQRLLHLPG